MLIFLLACAAHRLPEPTELMVSSAAAISPGATLATLTQGRELTLEHCANCHPPPKPADTQDAGWPEAFDAMVSKAEVSAEDAALIELYLKASLAQPAP